MGGTPMPRLVLKQALRLSLILLPQGAPMPSDPALVFLFDVDNTLLDNDRITAHLARHLEQTFGPASRQRYFAIFEELRRQLGYADYLGTLQRYRLENPHDVKLLTMSSFLVDYPFATRLYPQTLDVVDHVRQWGTPVILS